MNEKFFDIKKEKQDRIINAALKIFALGGYRQASTDDMVREAGISKGLLFHYFISKEGLFEFICDYSVKYARMEIGTVARGVETDYFTLCRQLELAKYQVMKQFPYMVLFLDTAAHDRTAGLTPERRAQLAGVFLPEREKADCSKYCGPEEAGRFRQLTAYVLAGSTRRWLADGEFNPERMLEENAAYLDMLQKLSDGNSV